MQCLKNHCPPSDWRLNVLTMLLAGYLVKEVAAILREILTHPTKKLYDDNTAPFSALIIGCSPSTGNCYIHCHVTMQRRLVKRTGPATDWLEYPLILGRPKNWSQLRLAPDSPIGLEASAMRIRCKCGFLPIGLRFFANYKRKEDVQSCQSFIGGSE